MTGELSKKFHGVGIGPLSKILTVKVLTSITTYYVHVSFVIHNKEILRNIVPYS